jgi:hypothetical protein
MDSFKYLGFWKWWRRESYWTLASWMLAPPHHPTRSSPQLINKFNKDFTHLTTIKQNFSHKIEAKSFPILSFYVHVSETQGVIFIGESSFIWDIVKFLDNFGFTSLPFVCTRKSLLM